MKNSAKKFNNEEHGMRDVKNFFKKVQIFKCQNVGFFEWRKG